MAVTAQAVKELRQKTGRPMMECKKALVTADGNVERAIDELRKSGAKAVQKLSSREAKDGKVAAWRNDAGTEGALVALCCETEPVTQNEAFLGFLQELLGAVVANKITDTTALAAISIDGTTVEEKRTELIAHIRENFTLGACAHFEADAVVQYVHFDTKKAAMIALEGAAPSETLEAFGKDLCMHVVMYRPAVLRREEVCADEVAREREVLEAQLKADPKNQNKPAEILAKITDGRLNKFFAERCFLEQPFIKDDSKTVAEAAKAHGVTIKAYTLVTTAS